MSYLEELLPEFRKGAKIRIIGSEDNNYYYIKHNVIYNQNGTPIKDFSLSIVMADIWKLANDIYYIVLYYNKYSVIALRSDELSIYRLLPCQLGEYVGKSKVNINDLFEVKSD